MSLVEHTAWIVLIIAMFALIWSLYDWFKF